jgi:8-oxo-dGTP pyrophosphatase MutT (NUDIX family)
LTDAAGDNPGGADAEGLARRTPRPRDAASLIVWRLGPAGPEVLMGRRHARHRFMPDVMVFPGGRVDADDHRQPAISELQPATRRMLERRATPGRARALAIAAARELQEETGLVLGDARGADLAALHYICRAVTPGRRPIRFNARFLAAPAEAVRGTIAGSGELEDLGWYTPEQAHRHHVADITGKVLVEFLDWLEMTARARASRPLVVFRGMDNRHQER